MATIGLSQPGGGGSSVVQGGIIFPGTRCYPTFTSAATAYTWTLQSAPSGSATVMNSSAGGAPYFDPDIVGNYSFRLVSTGTDAGTYNCTVVCQARGVASPEPTYLQSYENNIFLASASTVISGNTGTSGIVSFIPFDVPAPMALGAVQLAMSMSFSTLGNSSGQQTATQSWGLYSRVGGTAGTALTQIMASSYGIFVTGSDSTYSINQPTSTYWTGYSTGLTTSAGSAISSGYTGGKLVQLPINQTLQPGRYWLGLGNFHSTSSIIVGISNSYIGAHQVATMATLAPIGSFSANFSSGTDVARGIGGNWNGMLASFSSVGQTNLPSSVNMSLLTQNVSLIPYIRLLGT